MTIEQDLARRDLTINAIAVAEDGTIVDPFDGRGDLESRRLRHVGEAFIEDPVRVLRVARFAARFAQFEVADTTRQLMRHMAASGELSALVAERVWQEMARGLMEATPSRMVAVLEDVDAWPVLVPECPAPDGAALDRAAAAGLTLPCRFAVLVAGVPAARITALCTRLRVPNDCRELAEALARVEALMPALLEADAAELLRFLMTVDLLRRPRRLDDLIAVESARGRVADFGDWRLRLQQAQAAAAGVDQATIAMQARQAGRSIREAIEAAQTTAIAAATLAR